MQYEDSHISDQQLLLEVEGELSARDAKQVRVHIAGCWKCRARKQELDDAITGFVRVHQEHGSVDLPPIAGPRALLRAQLAQLAETQTSGWFREGRRLSWALGAAACGLVALGFLLTHSSTANPNVGRKGRSASRPLVFSVPNAALTPGATVLASRTQVCGVVKTNNKAVPVALQHQVFEEYGIAGAEPRAYEVDYLVTPALGGADDIHNLWPQPYTATVWNAQVKDALEDRLREMVCDGSLDLAEAQQEIAGDWIAAYKKYFHSDMPLAEHRSQQIQ
jgi:hypothetical protein